MRICILDGCGKRHVARGLCSSHYMSWKRHHELLHGRTLAWFIRYKNAKYADELAGRSDLVVDGISLMKRDDDE